MLLNRTRFASVVSTLATLLPTLSPSFPQDFLTRNVPGFRQDEDSGPGWNLYVRNLHKSRVRSFELPESDSPIVVTTQPRDTRLH